MEPTFEPTEAAFSIASGLSHVEALTLRGHALRERGTAEDLKLAVTAYVEALAALERLNLPASPDLINQTASLWMKRGIALLTSSDLESLHLALPCFEKALELRNRLPLEQQPWYRWGLSAAWMNRGDVLTRLGGVANLREAVRSFDLGIAHLHVLPIDAKPEIRWRLAVGWMNRGIAFQAMEDEIARMEALRSFDNSIAIMRGHEDSPRADYQRTLAAAWVNRANLLLGMDSPRHHEALEASRAAIQNRRVFEETDILMAETGIKARHSLCRSLAYFLETPPVDLAKADDWISEATDAVEESLRLARHWEARGQFPFRPILEELFHFGARIYRAFQPHFLAEFLLETLAPADPKAVISEAMHHAAREAICHAALQIRGEGLAALNPARLDRLLATLADLCGASSKLADMERKPL